MASQLSFSTNSGNRVRAATRAAFLDPRALPVAAAAHTANWDVVSSSRSTVVRVGIVMATVSTSRATVVVASSIVVTTVPPAGASAVTTARAASASARSDTGFGLVGEEHGCGQDGQGYNDDHLHV